MSDRESTFTQMPDLVVYKIWNVGGLENHAPLPADRLEREVAVCAFVEASEPCSSRQIAEEVNVSARTVRNILKRNGYNCYKVNVTQELRPGDPYRRLEFCESIRLKADADANFLNNILFSDETSFWLHGFHNSQNVCYWSRENQHLSVPLRTQYPEKLNIWTGILGGFIVGPFFIDGTLNADKYLTMLENQIIPAVRALPINFQEVWFQQDGCPAHNAQRVVTFLETTFPERLISSRGTIKWPPRSPDLSPNDFFLWGYAKTAIYGHEHERPRNLNDLRVRIVQVLQNISPEVLTNVKTEFYNRLGYCEAQEGDIFEPLLG